MELSRISSLTLEELHLAHRNGDFPNHLESFTLDELVRLSRLNEHSKEEEVFEDAHER